jgi:hypothetical protein
MAEKVVEAVKGAVTPKKKPTKEETKLRKVAQEVIDYQIGQLKGILTSIDDTEDPNRRLSQLGKHAPNIKNQIDIIKVYKEVLEVL